MTAWLLCLAAVAAPTTSPHGKASGCAACHATTAEGAVGAVLPIEPTCRGCHPDADMHPVGIVPDQIAIPDGWPLEAGRLTCATCHAEPAHDGLSGLPAPYHREGPYNPERDLCYRCHDRTTLAKHDPHHPAVARAEADPSCSACHTGRPETGAPPGRSRLRVEPGEACSSCHEGAVHVGVPEHVGSVVPAAVRRGLDGDLPLTPAGEMACWTCHEVHTGEADPEGPRRHRALREALRAKMLSHDWGDLKGHALHWPGEPTQDHPSLLSLPVPALCTRCHGDDP